MSKCITQISAISGWGSWRCESEAKYGDRCGMHDPERMKARAAKRKANRKPTFDEREMTSRKKELEDLKEENEKLREDSEMVDWLEEESEESCYLVDEWLQSGGSFREMYRKAYPKKESSND